MRLRTRIYRYVHTQAQAVYVSLVNQTCLTKMFSETLVKTLDQNFGLWYNIW